MGGCRKPSDQPGRGWDERCSLPYRRRGRRTIAGHRRPSRGESDADRGESGVELATIPSRRAARASRFNGLQPVAMVAQVSFEDASFRACPRACPRGYARGCPRGLGRRHVFSVIGERSLDSVRRATRDRGAAAHFFGRKICVFIEKTASFDVVGLLPHRGGRSCDSLPGTTPRWPSR
jgi:hypothetical protein